MKGERMNGGSSSKIAELLQQLTALQQERNELLLYALQHPPPNVTIRLPANARSLDTLDLSFATSPIPAYQRALQTPSSSVPIVSRLYFSSSKRNQTVVVNLTDVPVAAVTTTTGSTAGHLHPHHSSANDGSVFESWGGCSVAATSQSRGGQQRGDSSAHYPNHDTTAASVMDSASVPSFIHVSAKHFPSADNGDDDDDDGDHHHHHHREWDKAETSVAAETAATPAPHTTTVSTSPPSASLVAIQSEVPVNHVGANATMPRPAPRLGEHGTIHTTNKTIPASLSSAATHVCSSGTSIDATKSILAAAASSALSVGEGSSVHATNTAQPGARVAASGIGKDGSASATTMVGNDMTTHTSKATRLYTSSSITGTTKSNNHSALRTTRACPSRGVSNVKNVSDLTDTNDSAAADAVVTASDAEPMASHTRTLPNECHPSMLNTAQSAVGNRRGSVDAAEVARQSRLVHEKKRSEQTAGRPPTLSRLEHAPRAAETSYSTASHAAVPSPIDADTYMAATATGASPTATAASLSATHAHPSSRLAPSPAADCIASTDETRAPERRSDALSNDQLARQCASSLSAPPTSGATSSAAPVQDHTHRGQPHLHRPPPPPHHHHRDSNTATLSESKCGRDVHDGSSPANTARTRWPQCNTPPPLTPTAAQQQLPPPTHLPDDTSRALNAAAPPTRSSMPVPPVVVYPAPGNATAARGRGCVPLHGTTTGTIHEIIPMPNSLSAWPVTTLGDFPIPATVDFTPLFDSSVLQVFSKNFGLIVYEHILMTVQLLVGDGRALYENEVYDVYSEVYNISTEQHMQSLANLMRPNMRAAMISGELFAGECAARKQRAMHFDQTTLLTLLQYSTSEEFTERIQLLLYAIEHYGDETTVYCPGQTSMAMECTCHGMSINPDTATHDKRNSSSTSSSSHNNGNGPSHPAVPVSSATRPVCAIHGRWSSDAAHTACAGSGTTQSSNNSSNASTLYPLAIRATLLAGALRPLYVYDSNGNRPYREEHIEQCVSAMLKELRLPVELLPFCQLHARLMSNIDSSESTVLNTLLSEISYAVNSLDSRRLGSLPLTPDVKYAYYVLQETLTVAAMPLPWLTLFETRKLQLCVSAFFIEAFLALPPRFISAFISVNGQHLAPIPNSDLITPTSGTFLLAVLNFFVSAWTLRSFATLCNQLCEDMLLARRSHIRGIRDSNDNNNNNNKNNSNDNNSHKNTAHDVFSAFATTTTTTATTASMTLSTETATTLGGVFARCAELDEAQRQYCTLLTRSINSADALVVPGRMQIGVYVLLLHWAVTHLHLLDPEPHHTRTTPPPQAPPSQMHSSSHRYRNPVQTDQATSPCMDYSGAVLPSSQNDSGSAGFASSSCYRPDISRRVLNGMSPQAMTQKVASQLPHMTLPADFVLSVNILLEYLLGALSETCTPGGAEPGEADSECSTASNNAGRSAQLYSASQTARQSREQSAPCDEVDRTSHAEGMLGTNLHATTFTNTMATATNSDDATITTTMTMTRARTRSGHSSHRTHDSHRSTGATASVTCEEEENTDTARLLALAARVYLEDIGRLIYRHDAELLQHAEQCVQHTWTWSVTEARCVEPHAPLMKLLQSFTGSPTLAPLGADPPALFTHRLGQLVKIVTLVLDCVRVDMPASLSSKTREMRGSATSTEMPLISVQYHRLRIFQRHVAQSPITRADVLGLLHRLNTLAAIQTECENFLVLAQAQYAQVCRVTGASSVTATMTSVEPCRQALDCLIRRVRVQLFELLSATLLLQPALYQLFLSRFMPAVAAMGLPSAQTGSAASAAVDSSSSVGAGNGRSKVSEGVFGVFGSHVRAANSSAANTVSNSTSNNHGNMRTLRTGNNSNGTNTMETKGSSATKKNLVRKEAFPRPDPDVSIDTVLAQIRIIYNDLDALLAPQYCHEMDCRVGLFFVTLLYGFYVEGDPEVLRTTQDASRVLEDVCAARSFIRECLDGIDHGAALIQSSAHCIAGNGDSCCVSTNIGNAAVGNEDSHMIAMREDGAVDPSVLSRSYSSNESVLLLEQFFSDLCGIAQFIMSQPSITLVNGGVDVPPFNSLPEYMNNSIWCKYIVRHVLEHRRDKHAQQALN